MLINRASTSRLVLELRAWSRRRRWGRCALNAQLPLAHSVALAALFERELLVWLASTGGHVDDRGITDLQALALCGPESKTKPHRTVRDAPGRWGTDSSTGGVVLTSMTLVIVPLELVFHAPLQSQGLLQDAGSALQPYPQPTEAPSFVSQPVISQQPPFAEAIFTFVRCESPGVTPLLSSHCCSTTPAAQGWAEKASTSCQRVPARNSDKSSGSIGGVPPLPACQQLKNVCTV